MSRNHAIEDYWFKYYAEAHCTLCGNSGVIDTRGVRTNAGFETGRLNWCICPNGQILRDALGSDNSEQMLGRVRGARPGPVRDPMKRYDPLAVATQWDAPADGSLNGLNADINVMMGGRLPPVALLELTEGPLQPEPQIDWQMRESARTGKLQFHRGIATGNFCTDDDCFCRKERQW